MKILMAHLVCAALVSFVGPTAQAQSLCGDRTDLLETLSKRYHEVPISMGLSGNGGVVEILASEKGSWTIIVTRPSGVACVITAGEAWERLKKPVDQSAGI